jgi:hypothetical protein
MRSFFLLALLVATLTNFAYGGVVTPDALVKRDDYFPARVPYVFPAPGENPVADELRARRPGGSWPWMEHCTSRTGTESTF